MSVINNLLTTKLYSPRPRFDLVGRPRLIEQLNAGVQQGHQLFLVSAPPGYGKTTLLVEWLHQLNQPFTWLSLDNDDNDLQRFFSYLIGALQQIDPTIGEVTASLLASPQLPVPNTLATTLINDIASSSVSISLVLDDYHVITTPAIHEAVTFILDHQPPQLRLVLATRVDPPLPLARLRVRGRQTEIRADDLRFSLDETIALFDQAHLNLKTEAIHTLSARTEGWIAGLQMAALSMQGWDDTRIAEFVAAFSGSHHYVIDYLVDEVLRRQSDNVRDFLCQTAILDRLNAALCDAVTGRTDSRAILAQLERSNLFLIPLDQKRQWFRYHLLFADALRVELDADPQQSLLVHQRAAKWLEAHGYVRDALKHTLAAEAWTEAGRLITLAADDALNHFELGILGNWLDKLPDAAVLADPELALIKARVAYTTGHPDVSMSIVSTLDDVTPAQLSPRSWARLVSLRAVLATVREAPEAPRLVREALALTGKDDPMFRQHNLVILGLVQRLEGATVASSDSYREAVSLGSSLRVPAYTMHSMHDLAFTLIEQGRHREAQTMCETTRVNRSDARGQPFLTSDLLAIPLAAVAYEFNDLVKARDLALRGREAQRSLSQERNVGMESVQLLILTYAGLGDWDAAWNFIREAQQGVYTYRWFAPHIAVVETNLRLRQGDIEAAERWASTVQISFNDKPDEIREPRYFTYARLLIARGQPQEALRLLAHLETQVRDGGRLLRLITVHILQALAEAALDNQEAVRRLLTEAVRIAAPHGYSRRFLDEGPGVARWLAAVRLAAPAFIDNLLQAFGCFSPEHDQARTARTAPVGLHPLLPEPLTDQEWNVLRLLAEGLSYDGIAERLVITRSTAKWHIHNIYSKLGVNDRLRGIMRAQELGLI
ncbi:MAG: ATP-dependent transcriptional regulator [Chloroflexi bacterium]|jgi:LuxR family maltose regulon positive regulatory protein|nr:ATP-dependent transcriptional regulator [Chloroflexota bacterium]